MRDRAFYGMRGLGEERDDCPADCDTPYYRATSPRYIAYEGERSADDDEEYCLVFPKMFIKNLLRGCIDGYLEHCLAGNFIPFCNSKLTRKAALTWYETY